jgi:hypothetical protein
MINADIIAGAVNMIKRTNKQFKRQKRYRSISIRPFLWLLIFFSLSSLIHVNASDKSYPALRESIAPVLQKAFEKTLDQKFGKEFWDLVKARKVGIVHADNGVIKQKDKDYIIVALVQH